MASDPWIVFFLVTNSRCDQGKGPVRLKESGERSLKFSAYFLFCKRHSKPKAVIRMIAHVWLIRGPKGVSFYSLLTVEMECSRQAVLSQNDYGILLL
jgi:hypothetical protein